MEWERKAAPSQAAAVLLAEHAAIEAAVCLPFQREHRKQRLLLPAVVSAGPTIRSVIAGADYVLGLFTLASVPGRLLDRVGSTQGAADGHGRADTRSDRPDCPATLTALVSDWFALPSPRHEEAANTTSVDNSVYLRHLADHRAALDPFVTRYLAAADSPPVSAPSKSVTSPASPPCASPTCPLWPLPRSGPSANGSSAWSGLCRRTPPS